MTSTPRRALLTFASGLAVAVPAMVAGPAASAAGTVDQSQLTAVDGFSFFTPDVAFAQTFTAGATGALDRVDLRIGSVTSQPLAVSITDLGPYGAPGDETLAETTVPENEVQQDPAVTTATFAEPADVVAGEQYALVVVGEVGPRSDMYWLDSSEDPYAGGKAWATRGGAPWDAYDEHDFTFATYVDPAVDEVTRPTAPGIGAASSGTTGGVVNATARWTRPTSNGGLPITGYRVQAQKIGANGDVVSRVTRTTGARARSLVVRLPAGRYSFRVAAVNAEGRSPWSAGSAVVRAR